MTRLYAAQVDRGAFGDPEDADAETAANAWAAAREDEARDAGCAYVRIVSGYTGDGSNSRRQVLLVEGSPYDDERPRAQAASYLEESTHDASGNRL